MRHRHLHRSAVSRVAYVLATLVSLALLVVSGYAWATFRSANNGLQRLHVATGQPPVTTGHDIDGKDQNILVVGNTDRTTLTPAQQRALHVGSDASLATDTMMILHLPADGRSAQLISLPRDAYVAIPGYGMNKLNAAYVDGYVNAAGSLDAKRVAGADLLIKTVSNLTGLTIDHFVSVSMYGFVQISDAIGGVTVNLCHAVDDTVAHNRSLGISGGSGLVLSAGPHTIEGVTALEFVRQRHGLPNGDLDRTARQRYFLIQAFHKIASAGVLLDPTRLHALISAVDASIWVDDGLDLTSLALQASRLDPANIASHVIPFVRFANVDVGSVEMIDPAQVRAFVAKLIRPAAPAKGSAASSPARTTAPHRPAQPSHCIN